MTDGTEYVSITHITVHGKREDGSAWAHGRLLNPSGTPMILRQGDTLNINYKLNFEGVNDNQTNL